MSITRRIFLRHTASAGVVAAVAAPVAAAEAEITPRKKALWHLRELERLAKVDGASNVVVQVIGSYTGNEDCRCLGIHYSGRLMDNKGMFAPKGGES
ncbi:twin-arginine translocation signal domain-containing protein [Aquamicrobium soli]|uniref:Twin-arginine translocation signal domain-containing protein n=1 Tax=Aquamicrobium soli TaxID=1811518 RepID=A0ABV7KCS0_9HYPH